MSVSSLLSAVIVLSPFTFTAAAKQSSAAKPNVLFAIADDWSYGHAGAYGCNWVKTPAFDRVAREGVLFTRAYTPAAKCAPSRATVLTGRNPWQLEAACNHVPFFPAKFKSFPEALGENGYFVGMTGKGWAPGVATNLAGSPRSLTGREFQAKRTTPPVKGIGATDYAANFEDFLQSASADQTWCFWYGGLEPHRGYTYGSGVSERGKRLSDIPSVPGYWPDNETTRNDMLDYAFEIEHFDLHLARMLEALEQRGQLSNTLVIVTADNGMPFPRVKGQSYEDSNHMPLAVMWQQGVKRRGRTVSDYVSFVDFVPTILELAGLSWEQTGMTKPSGQSLVNLLRSSKTGKVDKGREFVLLGRERNDVGRPHDWGYPIRGIVHNDLLYLRNFEPRRWPAGNPETGYLDCDGSPTKTFILNARREKGSDREWQLCFGKRAGEELFDLRKDPHCLTNLAGSSAARRLQASLERTMVRELRKQNDLRMFGKGNTYEAHPYAEETYRNFYDKHKAGKAPFPGWVEPRDFELEAIP